MDKPIFGYWDNRTIAEPVRLCLAQAGVDYDDVRYSVGGPPDYDRAEWLSVKDTLGMAVPNLPYWIEPSGLRLSQQRAILLHIAEVTGLAGETAQRHTLVHMALETMHEWMVDFMAVTYCNKVVPTAEPGVHVAGES